MPATMRAPITAVGSWAGACAGYEGLAGIG
jgi:hypothetical protein